MTDDGVTTPFASLNILSVEVAYAVTPGTTDPLSTDASTSTSGSNDGANLTEVAGAGAAATAGVVVAGQLGGSPDGSAEHLGTSPNSLDTSSGLMSAMGGEGVHAMSFAGSEILPTANPAGTSLWLEESNQYGQTPTNWVSHPSGIGYRRSSPGVTTSGSGSGSGTTGAPIPGNPVMMDTGMSDAGTPAELSRISNNFITGGNENPTAMQPGPISKAEQDGTSTPLRPNVGNEMNVGGYTGYALLQQSLCSGDLPVFDHEAGNPAELGDVVRDERAAVRQGDGGNHQVVGADRLTPGGQLGSGWTVYLRRSIVERD